MEERHSRSKLESPAVPTVLERIPTLNPLEFEGSHRLLLKKLDVSKTVQILLDAAPSAA
jgi:hypothetical protein